MTLNERTTHAILACASSHLRDQYDRLALRFVLRRGKHWITRLKNRGERIQRLKDGLSDNERLGDLSRCYQGGATGVVAVVMTMRIV